MAKQAISTRQRLSSEKRLADRPAPLVWAAFSGDDGLRCRAMNATAKRLFAAAKDRLDALLAHPEVIKAARQALRLEQDANLSLAINGADYTLDISPMITEDGAAEIVINFDTVGEVNQITDMAVYE